MAAAAAVRPNKNLPSQAAKEAVTVVLLFVTRINALILTKGNSQQEKKVIDNYYCSTGTSNNETAR